MGKAGIGGRLRTVFLSTGFFYIIAGVILTLYIRPHPALGLAKLRTLNRLMPPLSALTHSNRGGGEIDPEYLDEATFYYRKVTEYLPANPNGYFMYGYCLVLAGRDAAAEKAFEASIERNSQYFWAHYNLGITRLRQGRWEQAEEAFRAALKTDPSVTVKVILASKVFQQLLAQSDNPQAVIVPGIKAGYADAQRWLAVTGRLKGLSPKDLPPPIYNQLRPVIY